MTELSIAFLTVAIASSNPILGILASSSSKLLGRSSDRPHMSEPSRGSQQVKYCLVLTSTPGLDPLTNIVTEVLSS